MIMSERRPLLLLLAKYGSNEWMVKEVWNITYHHALTRLPWSELPGSQADRMPAFGWRDRVLDFL
jgi:hypothetical protein